MKKFKNFRNQRVLVSTLFGQSISFGPGETKPVPRVLVEPCMERGLAPVEVLDDVIVDEAAEAQEVEAAAEAEREAQEAEAQKAALEAATKKADEEAAAKRSAAAKKAAATRKKNAENA